MLLAQKERKKIAVPSLKVDLHSVRCIVISFVVYLNLQKKKYREKHIRSHYYIIIRNVVCMCVKFKLKIKIKSAIPSF